MNQFRPGGFSLLPLVVKNLLIINILMFLATLAFSNFGVHLNDLLGLHWIGSEKFQVYQVITYMFMHGGISHIFFNMFAVWMFGNAIENAWGSQRFLTYYVLTGIGAAIAHYAIMYFTELGPAVALLDNFLNNPSSDTLSQFVANYKFQISEHSYIYQRFHETSGAINAVLNGNNNPATLELVHEFVAEYKTHYLNAPVVVGASGSLFGILLAFGMMFPNVELFMIFLPIPIKAKYFVLGYGLIELVSGIQNSPSDNVAHFAHLGGMVFGFLLIKMWQNK